MLNIVFKVEDRCMMEMGGMPFGEIELFVLLYLRKFMRLNRNSTCARNDSMQIISSIYINENITRRSKYTLAVN